MSRSAETNQVDPDHVAWVQQSVRVLGLQKFRDALVEAVARQSFRLDPLLALEAGTEWSDVRKVRDLLRDVSEQLDQVVDGSNDFTDVFGPTPRVNGLWVSAFRSWWAVSRLNNLPMTAPLQEWTIETLDPEALRFMDERVIELHHLARASNLTGSRDAKVTDTLIRLGIHATLAARRLGTSVSLGQAGDASQAGLTDPGGLIL